MTEHEKQSLLRFLSIVVAPVFTGMIVYSFGGDFWRGYFFALWVIGLVGWINIIIGRDAKAQKETAE